MQKDPQMPKISKQQQYKPIPRQSPSKLPPIAKHKAQVIPQITINGQQRIPPSSSNHQQKQDKQSTTKSTSVSNKVRKFMAQQYDQKAIVLCQFCGGATCPQQDYKTNTKQPNAIKGLHSNWINEHILAMQRPSNRLIEEYKLIEEFKKYKINTILNLQEPGEHPYCGDGIDAMIGFSYDPQIFFMNGIRFENEYWQDMTSTTFEQMIKILNIFERSIVRDKGKISVHCHAGRGRTLMAICAWLIYYDRMTAEQTIELAVEKRQGVLTRTSQRDFLRDFEKEAKARWKSYRHVVVPHIKTFSEFIDYQHGSLLKSEIKQLNYTAFAHGKILTQLRQRLQKESIQILYALTSFQDETYFKQKWEDSHEHRVENLKVYIDKLESSKISPDEDVRVLVALLDDFYQEIPYTVMTMHAVDKIKEEFKTQESILKKEENKREVKLEALDGKVLKRWDDIVSQRKSEQQKTIVIEGENSELGVNSRIKEGKDISDGGGEQKGKKEHLEEADESQRLKFASSSNSGFGKSGNISDLVANSIYLKVLSEPSVIHEIGLASLFTVLDLVRFCKQLMDQVSHSKKFTPQQTQKFQKVIFTRISIMLQSKKRYFPLLFYGPKFRESKVMKRLQKLQKYSNENIVYLGNFMKQVSKEIPLDMQEYEKLLFKFRKVDANLQYFTKSCSSSNGKFFSVGDVKKVYNQSRIQ